MKESLKNFNLNTRNTELPFFASFSYDLEEADKTDVIGSLEPFMWIQVFFDETFAGIPQLAVFSGRYVEGTSTPVVSAVAFAYSGAIMPFKGNAILASGVNMRGQTVESTVIGDGDPTSMISRVIVYGGMY